MCNIEAINESKDLLDKKFIAYQRAEERYRKQMEKHIEIIKRNRNTERVEKLCDNFSCAYMYMANLYGKRMENEYKSKYLDFKCDLKTILQVKDIEIDYLDNSSPLNYIITFSIPEIKNNFALVIPRLTNMDEHNFEQMNRGKYRLVYNLRIRCIKHICDTYDAHELGETLNTFIKEYKKANRNRSQD